MRIVTWNCNGALRKKIPRLQELDADIYVIQECENPITVTDPGEGYLSFSENHLWNGSNKNKGIGVFAGKGSRLEPNKLDHSWRGRTLQWFLPCNALIGNETMKLLGVWNHGAKAKAFDYIGQSWLFLQNNKEYFRDAIVIGDFNSNSIWDSWDRWWNHTDYVEELCQLGLTSIYHSMFHELQGQETRPTFYLQKKLEKGYHIDFCFANVGFATKTTQFRLHEFEEWKDISDHVPVEWEFETD